MTARFTKLITLVAVLFSVANAAATDAIVKHRATLRKDPSTRHAPLVTLTPGEDVEVIDSSLTAGYYHVRTLEGDEGWVYSRNLEIVTAHRVSPAPAPHSPSSTAQPAAPAAVEASISPSWDKPDPNKTTFHSMNGDCGPTGDGGDALTNARKNRSDEAAEYHLVTWKAVQALPYPTAARSLADWTPEQLAADGYG